MHSNALDTLDFQRLFPDGVICISASSCPSGFRLQPEEEAATAGMTTGRYDEFCLGRVCARELLNALGSQNTAVPVGAHREPIWPRNFVGSIAHAGGLAIAAGGLAERFQGLGVDIEEDAKLAPDLVPLICSDAELARCRDQLMPADSAKILFSIKESVFKCLWPSMQTYFDFLDVEVQIDVAMRTYRATATNAALPAGLVERVTGGFTTAAGLLASSAILERNPD